jgi:hypothetical protein
MKNNKLEEGHAKKDQSGLAPSGEGFHLALHETVFRF